MYFSKNIFFIDTRMLFLPSLVSYLSDGIGIIYNVSVMHLGNYFMMLGGRNVFLGVLLSYFMDTIFVKVSFYKLHNTVKH
jgi:hypothetical protein